MKKMLLPGIAFVLSLAVASAGSAQAIEHKGMMGQSTGMMMEHMHKKGMMGHDEMMGHMMDMMRHMSDMMGKMSGMMKTMPKDKMKKMHKMMDEMGTQIKHMNNMMKMGAVSEKELKKMQGRQKRMDKILQQLETQ